MNMEILTREEAAKFLRIKKQTLCNWVSTGKGPVYIKLGRRVCYLMADLEKYVESRRIDLESTAK